MSHDTNNTSSCSLSSLALSTAVPTSSLQSFDPFSQSIPMSGIPESQSLSSHLEALKKTQNRPFQKNKSHSSLVSIPSLICTSVLVMLTDPLINFEFLPVRFFLPKT